MKQTSVEIVEMIKKTVAPNLNVNSLAQQIRQYGKHYCKKQVQKCRGIYSANRHKSPQDIKTAILKSLITEFE